MHAPTPPPRDLPPRQSFPEGVLKKEEFLPHLTATIIKARQTGEPISVAISDLDSFKAVNDTYGHGRGDEVIHDFGEVADHTFRTGHQPKPSEHKDTSRALDVIFAPSEHSGSDEMSHIGFVERWLRRREIKKAELEGRVARYGGDECAFEISADTEGAKRAVARLKQNWEDFLKEERNADIAALGVSPSVGIATMTAEMNTMEPEEAASLLVTMADNDMREDKIRNIPNLTRRERIGVIVGGFVLRKAGIRQRDLPKFQKAFDHQRRQRNEKSV